MEKLSIPCESIPNILNNFNIKDRKIIISKKIFLQKEDKYGYCGYGNLAAYTVVNPYIYVTKKGKDYFLTLIDADYNNYNDYIYKIKEYSSEDDIRKAINKLISDVEKIKNKKDILIMRSTNKKEIFEHIKKRDPNAEIYDVNKEKPWRVGNTEVEYYGGWVTEPIYNIKYFNRHLNIAMLPYFYEDELPDNYNDLEDQLFYCGAVNFEGSITYVGLEKIIDGYYIVTQITGFV